MKKLTISMLLLVLIFVMPLKAQHKIKVIDNETHEPVSFAVISVLENKNFHSANLDGILSIDIDRNSTYKLTRLGYKVLSISGEQLSKTNEILMETQSIEINPIIISAKDAWDNLNKAIENTYNLIPKTPFYLGCWQNDIININEQTVISAKAMYVSKISKLYKINKGCSFITKIKGLQTINVSGINVDTLNKFRYYNVPNVNQFAAGANDKITGELLFYSLDSNDTCVIIGYKPKSTYNPDGKTVLSSGRFVINKENWTLNRFDSELSSKMIIQKNKHAAKASKYQYKSFKRTVFFSKKGVVEKLHEIIEFSYKKNDVNTTSTNTLIHVYKEISEKDYLDVPLKIAKNKSIIYQKPFFKSSFDSEFENGFKNK